MAHTSESGATLRRTRSLDGTWEFVADPDDTGTDAAWYDSGVRWPDRARTVEVPHAWQEMGDYREYTGVAWYRRPVEVADDALDGRDAVLRFGAVDYETTVWVNGREVGRNRGGFLPFEVAATDALEPGENTVVVRVVDPADLTEIPHGKQGDPWYTRVSGIWQSVTLAVRPRSRVTGARVTPDLSTDTATVDVDVESGPRQLEDLACTVRALRDGDVVASADVALGDGTTAVLSFADPDYWWPSDPALYDLDVRLREGGDSAEDGEGRHGDLLDRYADTFGLRSIAADDEGFRLNGEPFRIRGVLEQGYYPETLYRPHEGWSFEREVATAKQLGFNLVRKHIKPAHPDFLAAADRQGVLVWEEPANPTRDTERSRREVTAQVRGLVERDYNHPSVVVWGLYNEEWGLGHADGEETLWIDEEKQRFLADEVTRLRERDPTRLVCDNSGWAHVATDVNDFHRYFASPEQATDWERDLDHICHYAADNYATGAFETPDAPVVVSECGAWGLGAVGRLRDRYGGDPPWFDHDFLTEAYKRPAGVDRRFAATGLSDAFADLSDLANAWQARQFTAVKHVLEAMRVRERVDGYVLTQLSDIEWEFNGLLEYDREQKSFLRAFEEVNAPLAVVARPSSRVVRAGDSLEPTVHLVNDTARERSGTIEWALGDRRGTVEATVGSGAVETVTLPSVAVDPVADGPVGHRELTVRFRAGDRTARTTEPVTVLDRDGGPSVPATVYAEGALAPRLARNGVTVTHDLSDEVDLAFARDVTGEVERFASQGGTVVHVPDEDGRMRGGGPFTYRTLPDSESWVRSAGLFYRRSSLLADLCPDRVLGWEFDGIYPVAVATDVDSDRVHVGYVEGWLANVANPLVAREYGDGTVVACTFRVPGSYGSNPAATLLCDRLVETLTDTA
ncbi:MAG: sugar-binding domain-containing protein [Haloarculaceae archaeon]